MTTKFIITLKTKRMTRAGLDEVFVRQTSSDSHVLAQEIADDLRFALAQIEDALGDLEQRVDLGAGRHS